MIEIIDEDTIRSSDWGIVRFKPAPKGKNGEWTEVSDSEVPKDSGWTKDKTGKWVNSDPNASKPWNS